MRTRIHGPGVFRVVFDVLLGLSVATACVACGPSAELLRASDTVATASEAVSGAGDVVSRAEADAPTPAVERIWEGHGRALVRIDDAEEVLRFWREGGVGKVGWATMAPCLAASLEGLVMLLQAAGLEVPAELPQALVEVTEVNGDQCPSEPRPSLSGAATDGDAATSGGEVPAESSAESSDDDRAP
ncbi:MAG: hypothetical protein DRJ42_09850 [Deltaproteobacteria bacterium]|nr:MAG: hypothetical protein DRJ42_09850 [Deltaproteobacteria bacterium]